MCENCNNCGWIESIIYFSKEVPDEIVVIEKCDDCNTIIDDNIAAKQAFIQKKIISFRTTTDHNVKINLLSN